MSENICTMEAVNYDSIIEQVWAQFQTGNSIFSKEGGLAHWSTRQMLIDEPDAFHDESKSNTDIP